MNNMYKYNEINNVNGINSVGTDKYSAPIDFNVGNGVIGSYDNIRFKTECSPEGWKRGPCNPPVKDPKLFVPQGTPLPLKNEEIYTLPPTDSIFPFNYAYASPLCTSTYSTDRGQLCLPADQQKYIGEMRGGNKTYENYNF